MTDTKASSRRQVSPESRFPHWASAAQDTRSGARRAEGGEPKRVRQQRFTCGWLSSQVMNFSNTSPLQPLAILGERRCIPHRIVRRQADEPATQQVVVQLLHQLPFRRPGETDRSGPACGRLG